MNATQAPASWGPCLTCFHWSHNKQAKRGCCTKSHGRTVSDPALEHTRIAYPGTVSSEGCPEHREGN
jgi:hypothetical protein